MAGAGLTAGTALGLIFGGLSRGQLLWGAGLAALGWTLALTAGLAEAGWRALQR